MRSRVARRIGDRDIGVQLQPMQIGGEKPEAFRGAIEGGDRGARAGELRGFAARRGAHVEHPLVGFRVEEARRQRRRRILHPPFALVEA